MVGENKTNKNDGEQQSGLHEECGRGFDSQTQTKETKEVRQIGVNAKWRWTICDGIAWCEVSKKPCLNLVWLRCQPRLNLV